MKTFLIAILLGILCLSSTAYSQRARRADSITTFFVTGLSGFDRYPDRGIEDSIGYIGQGTRFLNIDTGMHLNAEIRNLWDHPSYKPAPPNLVLGGMYEAKDDVLILEPLTLTAAFWDAGYVKFEFERHSQGNDSSEYPGFLDHSGLSGHGKNDSTVGTSPAFLLSSSRATPFKSLKVRTASDSAGIINDSIWLSSFIGGAGNTPLYCFRGGEQRKLLVRVRVKIDTSMPNNLSAPPILYILTITEDSAKHGKLVTHKDTVRIDSQFQHINADFDNIDYRFIRNDTTKFITFSFDWQKNVNATFDYMEVMTAHIEPTDSLEIIKPAGYPLNHADVAANSGEDFMADNPTNLIAVIDTLIKRYSPDANKHYINYIQVGDEFGSSQSLPFKRLVKLMRERSNGRVEIICFPFDSSFVGLKSEHLRCDECGFGTFIGHAMGIPDWNLMTFEGLRLGWVDTSKFADPKIVGLEGAAWLVGIPLPKRSATRDSATWIQWEDAHAPTGSSNDSGDMSRPTAFHYNKNRYMQKLQTCYVPTYLDNLRYGRRLNERNNTAFATLLYTGAGVDLADFTPPFLKYASCLREVTAPELKLASHISTSCGTSGIVYYTLINGSDSVGHSNGGFMNSNGDHSAMYQTFHMGTASASMWMGYKERYDTAKTLIPIIIKYGTTLLHSKCLGDWTASELPNASTTAKNLFPFVFNTLKTYDDSLHLDTLRKNNAITNALDTANRTFVHISIWVDTLAGKSDTMLYVTNMRTDDSYDTTEVATTIDRRLITLQFKREHIIIDMNDTLGGQLDNGKIWTPFVGRNATDSLKLFLLAGDGILIKLKDTLQGHMLPMRVAINYPKGGLDFNDHGRVKFNYPVPGVLDKSNPSKWSVPSTHLPYIVGIADTSTAKMWQDSLLYQTIHTSRPTQLWRHHSWDRSSSTLFQFQNTLAPSTVRPRQIATDSIAHNIIIGTELESIHQNYGKVRIYDPWFVNDTTLLNHNTSADTLARPLPFNPRTSPFLGGDSNHYGGIFLKQNLAHYDSIPMYALNAYKTIKAGTYISKDTIPYYTDWVFLQWATKDTVVDGDLKPWDSVTTIGGYVWLVNHNKSAPVVFGKDSAKYTARYKAHMASFSTSQDENGFEHNNQRKLFFLRVDTLNRNHYRIVYSSNGRIFTATGYKNGVSNAAILWDNEELVSDWDHDSFDAFEYPALAMHFSPYDSTAHIVYQAKIYGQNYILLTKQENGLPIYTADVTGDVSVGSTPAIPAISGTEGKYGSFDVIAWANDDGINVKAVGALGKAHEIWTDNNHSNPPLHFGNSTARNATIWIDTCSVCGNDSSVHKVTLAWQQDTVVTSRWAPTHDTVSDIFAVQFNVVYCKYNPGIKFFPLPGLDFKPKDVSLIVNHWSYDNRNPCISGARYATDTDLVRVAFETTEDTAGTKQGITVAHLRSGSTWKTTKFFRTSNPTTDKFTKPTIEVSRYHHPSGGAIVPVKNYYSLIYERQSLNSIQHWAMDSATQRVTSYIFENLNNPQLAVVKASIDSAVYRMAIAPGDTSDPRWLISGYTGLYKYAGTDSLWGYHSIMESDSTGALMVEHGYGELSVDNQSTKTELEIIERDDSETVDASHPAEYFTQSENFTLPASGTVTYYRWVKPTNDSIYQSMFDTTVFALDFFDTSGVFICRLDSATITDSVTRLRPATISIAINRDSSSYGYVKFIRLTNNLASDQSSWQPIIMTERLSGAGSSKRINHSLDFKSDDLAFTAQPNPSRGDVLIGFTLPQEANVKIDIFNLLGQELGSLVPTTMLGNGRHNYMWHPRDLPSGIYTFILHYGNFEYPLRVNYIK